MDTENFFYHSAQNRGSSDLGWLQSKFSFSFASYYNPDMIGFGTLRVLNDDIVAPGQGFGKHSHSDMEIITIPTHGSLAHSDSMGNKTVITRGEVQAMSAGTGIIHSEMNNSSDEYVKFFQIWIQTKNRGITPHYSQKKFDDVKSQNTFQLLVSPSDSKETVKIHQDAFISKAIIDKDLILNYKKYKQDNGIYIFVVQGEIHVGRFNLSSRDALGVESLDQVSIISKEKTEILILEVPMQ